MRRQDCLLFMQDETRKKDLLELKRMEGLSHNVENILT